MYNAILEEIQFKVYSDAYRYVIEINDVKLLVEKYIQYEKANITIDLANPYRYNIINIVSILEKLLNKKAKYELVDKRDEYLLDLRMSNLFLEKYNINVGFGEEYLYQKLKEKIKRQKIW